MKGPQLTEYTRISAADMIAALRSIDSPDVEALIQFGANLPLAAIADEAERWLGKPVIPVNTATYWHALRHNGIADKLQGHTRLLPEFSSSVRIHPLARHIEVGDQHGAGLGLGDEELFVVPAAKRAIGGEQP